VTSPTQRTLAYLRKLGWQVAVTEHWQAIPNHPGGGIRKDLWNFGDMLAVSPDGAHVIVQCTAAAVTDRCKKIDAIPEAARWLRSGGEILVIGWRKLKPRGTKVPHWHPRILFADLLYEGDVSGINWREAEVSA
jgi:hypothetical protein